MIPILAALRIGRRRALWIPIPLLLIWLLLLPFCPLALPFFVAVCRNQQVPVLKALRGVYGLLRGVAGMRLEIEHPDVNLALRVI